MICKSNRKTCLVVLLFLLWMCCTAGAGRTITVDDDGPADFNNIQAAINDANDGDTITVADGTYTGYGNRDIDFLGKAITVRSENGPDNCVIDCEGTEADKHRGFNFQSGEDANSVLDGLGITNGYASHGGGINCIGGSSPTIKKCILSNNAGSGGGIYCEDSSPQITNCVITNNVAPLRPGFPGPITSFGGGLYCANSSPSITNCIITRNSATACGGGIFSVDGNPFIGNCTLTYNSTDCDGGGIACYSQCVMTVSNCILWGNTANRYGPQISVKEIFGYPIFSISYSDVEGGREQVDTNWWKSVNWGAGNIDTEPFFAYPVTGDYHLKSQAGRWEPSSQSWVQDDVTSPCLDAGNPQDPIGQEPFPNGGIINMGAYGGTTEASKSYFGAPPCETIVAGDINGDCKVNFKDFALMAAHWLRENH